MTKLAVKETNKEIVFIENNEVITDSKKVAEVFGKQHIHVMEGIRSLEAEMNRLKFSSLFQETTYKPINAKRSYPKYNITKDGFTLLVMGFTGKKALQFKMMYINEFNRMEEELQELVQTPVQPFTLPTTYKEALIALVESEEVKEQLLLENQQQQQVIEEQQPKVTTYESIFKGGTEYTATEIAKRYVRKNGKEVSAEQINKILEQEGYLDSFGTNHKEPTKLGTNIGGTKKRFKSGSVLVIYTKWTEQAVQELHEVFESHGLELI